MWSRVVDVVGDTLQVYPTADTDFVVASRVIEDFANVDYVQLIPLLLACLKD
jgi:hypothetical protein